MITERPDRIRRSAAIMALLLMFWFSVSAAMTFTPGITQAATILFPSNSLMNNLPQDISVLRWDRATASVTSADPDFVRRLYRAGAFMVLPARKAGCLDARAAKAKEAA
jgi:hypothetical protein